MPQPSRIGGLPTLPKTRNTHVASAKPPPRPALEVTGGVTLASIEALAATGVGRISSGALTHSARALDISLKIIPTPKTNTTNTTN